jgi:hypothetical protein
MLREKSGILKKSIERLDRLYRQKQTPGVLLKSQKTVPEIELPRTPKNEQAKGQWFPNVRLPQC